MSSTPSSPQTPGGVPSAPQKSSGTKMLLWIVGIVVGLVLISFASCAVLGFYAMHKVKQAGFDSDLMKKNPALATAKMAVTMSPDTEVVSSDDNAGTITVSGLMVTAILAVARAGFFFIKSESKPACFTLCMA